MSESSGSLTAATMRKPMGDDQAGSGALRGIKVIEFAGLGPVPFAAMMLADHGADVIRIDRPGSELDPHDPVGRSRRSICLDLKHPEGLAIANRLLRTADILLEGFRPDVMERLQLGPGTCTSDNPRLIYARLSGWGRRGPWASAPGRDLNYVAMSGALAAIGGCDQPPAPPLNLVGDYGGGAMLLTAGILMALYARERTGKGQVVDASILSGATLLTTWICGQVARGAWLPTRESNLLDGGAPFYRAYRCRDGGWLTVGAIDADAGREFLDGLGVPADDPLREAFRDRSRWHEATDALSRRIAILDRDEWVRRFSGTRACVAAALTFAEAPRHPQHLANGTFQTLAGVTQPAPAPEFSGTAAPKSRPPCRPGEHTREILAALAMTDDEIGKCLSRGIAR
jgi:alpha-methylacyl-CoA racemase